MSSLKDYLKKYESGGNGNDGIERKKKKKRKNRDKSLKPRVANMVGGVLIVDEDPMWHKPIILEEQEENHSSDEDAVVVEEDIEVKRLRRLEAIRSRKPYLSVSEDGSGWTSVSINAGKDEDLGNTDLSPPRKHRERHFDSPSPEHDGQMLDDFLPSRSGVKEDLSPPRRGQHRSPDLSPPRRGQHRSPDLSPPRRGRHRSPDLSPPRRGRHRSPDLSPPRRGRHRSPDLSPPRRGRHRSQDLSPPQKHSQKHFDKPLLKVEDLSPPKRRRHDSVDSQISHKTNKEADLSLPGRKKDNSLVHRSYPEPPSKIDKPLSGGFSLPKPSNANPSSTKMDRKGGIFSRSEIKEVIDKKKADDVSRLLALDPVKSGKGAEPVFRVKGKRVSKEEKLKLEKKDEKTKEVKLEWGKGLAQKREAEAREKEVELEKEKPFARTRDDPELDNMLKERIRWGDPMAHLVKKKHSELLLEDFGADEKMKESGFLIPQSIPNHSWLKRGVDPPPNRFNIRPGRHWDGVDRSTGYEKELFKRQNEKTATQNEAYLWSVSEM